MKTLLFNENIVSYYNESRVKTFLVGREESLNFTTTTRQRKQQHLLPGKFDTQSRHRLQWGNIWLFWKQITKISERLTKLSSNGLFFWPSQ